MSNKAHFSGMFPYTWVLCVYNMWEQLLLLSIFPRKKIYRTGTKKMLSSIALGGPNLFH